MPVTTFIQSGMKNVYSRMLNCSDSSNATVKHRQKQRNRNNPAFIYIDNQPRLTRQIKFFLEEFVAAKLIKKLSVLENLQFISIFTIACYWTEGGRESLRELHLVHTLLKINFNITSQSMTSLQYGLGNYDKYFSTLACMPLVPAISPSLIFPSALRTQTPSISSSLIVTIQFHIHIKQQIKV
jgi:hypothetical protein